MLSGLLDKSGIIVCNSVNLRYCDGTEHMFGYMIADIPALSEEGKKRYRDCYCGLCRAIGRQSGQLCRCCLAFDTAFLTLTLNALYEPEEAEEARPCPIHPLQKRRSWTSPVTDYAADMNVLLARLNALDDWLDDRDPLKWAEAKLLEKAAAAASERNPRQWAVLRESMAALRDTETLRDPSPDPGANAVGRMLGELFVWREDRWAPALRALGTSLGRFIYLLDAVTDRKRDERRGLYNPVSAMVAQGASQAELREILLGLMADAAAAWETLPLLRDTEIQRSILYDGAWKRLPVMEETNT